MKHSMEVGFSFGITSGIITTLGLMIGLYSGTASKLVVIGGILTIAVADAFSDALGIHISEEFENRHTANQIWVSTVSTFLSKFIFASTFVIPVLLLELSKAIIVSVFWGILMLTGLSYWISRQQKINPGKVIIEHLAITVIVIVLSNFLGKWIGMKFG